MSEDTNARIDQLVKGNDVVLFLSLIHISEPTRPY